MKNPTLLLFFLIAALYGCTLEDVTPSYVGRYKFAYNYTETKYGVTKSSDTMDGVMEVEEGSSKGTVTLNKAMGSKGNLIDFSIKAGNYSYNEKFEIGSCQCALTIEGRFDSHNYMTYKQKLIVTCGDGVMTGLLEGKGVR